MAGFFYYQTRRTCVICGELMLVSLYAYCDTCSASFRQQFGREPTSVELREFKRRVDAA
jgi:hypothetical protein